jgi:uncharacterized membrane protein
MAEDKTTDRIRSYINANPGWSTIYIFSLIFAVIGLGSVLLPEIFWDQFVWRYFWGSVVADAEDRTVGGITEGYNIVSTLAYGIILAAAILVIYRIIVILDINMDHWFFLAVIPYILFGGFARALEDAMLFNTPVVYLFISPIIYILTGLATLGLMVIAHYLSKLPVSSKKKGSDRSSDLLKWLILIFVVINILLTVVFFQPGWTNYTINRFIPFMITVLVFLIILFYVTGKQPVKNMMPVIFGASGLIMFSYPAVAVAQWFTQPEDWVTIVEDASFGDPVVLRPFAIFVIIGLALLATAIWAGVAFQISRSTKLKQAALFFSGVNLALVFGQFTDAAATFIAIDYYNYWEKHVLPGFLIGITDTAAIMFLLKVIALFFAIYVLDIYLKDELKKYQKIVPLIKIAVMVLGLAPGTRDMLRLAMGV